MHQAKTVELSAEQRQCADPDSLATAVLADDHMGEQPSSGAAKTRSSTIATGSGVAVLCVVEGTWLWLLGTCAVWLLGAE
jgi:hypothetical protein